MRQAFICLVLSLNLVIPFDMANASMGIGRISMRVISAIFLESKSNMAFPSASPGADSVSISPEDPASAKFQVRGEPNTSFQITLPEMAELILDGGGDINKIIKIKMFKSIPETSGTLNAQGEQILSVGATRDALVENQVEGDYVGTYTISIVY